MSLSRLWGRNSIRRRVVVSGLIWSLFTVGAAALLLVGLFQTHIERQAAREVDSHLLRLIALTRTGPEEGVTLRDSLSDPRFALPFSGWAWQISRGDAVLAQSPSLGPLDARPAKLLAPPDQTERFTGPFGEALFGTARDVTLTGTEQVVTFALARPQRELQTALTQFRQQVWGLLALLIIAQTLSVVLVMRVSLAPLEVLRQKVVAMRRDESQMPEPEWPEELAPIAAELDELDHHVERLVEQGRGRAADLAHAIKTPLAVLRQLHAQDPRPGLRDQLSQQTGRIDTALARHLAHGPTTGRARNPVRVSDVVADLDFALQTTFADSNIASKLNIAPEIIVLCDEADLYEALGNVAENAFKQAAGQVHFHASANAHRIQIVVEDDGPGVADEEIHRIMQRGVRLDQSADGHGLGLPIARSLVEAYGGSLTLARSVLGGLQVTLEFPVPDQGGT